MQLLPEYKSRKPAGQTDETSSAPVVPKAELVPGETVRPSNHRSRVPLQMCRHRLVFPRLPQRQHSNLAYNDYLNGKYDLAVAGFLVEGSQLAFAHEAAATYQREKPDIVPLGQILRTYRWRRWEQNYKWSINIRHTSAPFFNDSGEGGRAGISHRSRSWVPEPIDLSAAQSALLLKRCDDLRRNSDS